VATRGRGTRSSRGNAQTLRNYWSTGGAGGAKIRWGTPGDWSRCTRQLHKYLGARAKGYCQLLHIRNTGMATSTHAKALRGGRSKRR